MPSHRDEKLETGNSGTWDFTSPAAESGFFFRDWQPAPIECQIKRYLALATACAFLRSWAVSSAELFYNSAARNHRKKAADFKNKSALPGLPRGGVGYATPNDAAVQRRRNAVRCNQLLGVVLLIVDFPRWRFLQPSSRTGHTPAGQLHPFIMSSTVSSASLIIW